MTADRDRKLEQLMKDPQVEIDASNNFNDHLNKVIEEIQMNETREITDEELREIELSQIRSHTNAMLFKEG